MSSDINNPNPYSINNLGSKGLKNKNTGSASETPPAQPTNQPSGNSNLKGDPNNLLGRYMVTMQQVAFTSNKSYASIEKSLKVFNEKPGKVKAAIKLGDKACDNGVPYLEALESIHNEFFA